MPAACGHRRASLLALAAGFATLYVVWGSTYLGIKFGAAFATVLGLLSMIPLTILAVAPFFTGDFHTSNVTPFTTSGQPWNVAVTVAGSSGSPASLTYNSVASLADTVTLTGADAGTIGSPGLASVQFSNVGTVTTNASQSPGDQLTVNLPICVAENDANCVVDSSVTSVSFRPRICVWVKPRINVVLSAPICVLLAFATALTMPKSHSLMSPS